MMTMMAMIVMLAIKTFNIDDDDIDNKYTDLAKAKRVASIFFGLV